MDEYTKVIGLTRVRLFHVDKGFSEPRGDLQNESNPMVIYMQYYCTRSFSGGERTLPTTTSARGDTR